jgi:putative salt-induced outer membrane protein YdiY
MPRLSLSLLFIASLLAAPLLASPVASVLILENGDRISGHEVKREGGRIHFQSDLLGLLTVPEDKAEVKPAEVTDLELQLATAEAPTAGFPETATATAATPAPEEKPEPTPAPLPAPDPSLPPVVAAVQKDDKPVAKPATVKRLVEFGYTSQSGRRDRTDISVRGSIERKTKTTELRWQGRYLYGESDDQRVADNLNSSIRFRRDLSPKMFAQAEAKYERDSIKNLENDFTQSLGMGRNLFEREGFKLAIGGGAAARYRDVINQDDEWVYQLDAFQDLVYAFNSRLRVTQDMSVQVSPSDSEEFLLKLNAALTSKITNALNMSMRYEFEYDRSLIPASRENQRIVTSIGYAF